MRGQEGPHLSTGMEKNGRDVWDCHEESRPLGLFVLQQGKNCAVEDGGSVMHGR